MSTSVSPSNVSQTEEEKRPSLIPLLTVFVCSVPGLIYLPEFAGLTVHRKRAYSTVCRTAAACQGQELRVYFKLCPVVWTVDLAAVPLSICRLIAMPGTYDSKWMPFPRTRAGRNQIHLMVPDNKAINSQQFSRTPKLRMWTRNQNLERRRWCLSPTEAENMSISLLQLRRRLMINVQIEVMNLRSNPVMALELWAMATDRRVGLADTMKNLSDVNGLVDVA